MTTEVVTATKTEGASGDEPRIKVLVYGSLKAGQPNHRVLESETTDFLGDCVLDTGFSMVDLGWYPGVVREIGGSGITGEVYQVDETTFHSLDILEGHPTFYRREKVETVDYKNVWIYLLPVTYLSDCDRVEGGIWHGCEGK